VNISRLPGGAYLLVNSSPKPGKAALTGSAASGYHYSMLSLGDSRPRWHHFAARMIRWSGALWASEKFANRHRLSFPAGKRLPSLKNAAAPQILILCYHRIGTGGIPFYSELPASQFEQQMKFLRKHYRILSLAKACRELESPSGPQPSVVVTFDDGYSDLFAQAMPILRRYEIPATVYLTVGAVETGEVAWYDRIFLALKHASGSILEFNLGDCRPRRFYLSGAHQRFYAAVEIITELRSLPDSQRRQLCADLEARVQLPPAELKNRMLSWDQVRSMQSAGVSFGCHTMTHPAVSRLTAADMEVELVESKELMEKKIGEPVLDFAYPFGKPPDCGKEARQVLERGGYRSAVTTAGGVNSSGTDPFQLLRVNPGDERSLDMFAVQMNWHFLSAQSPSGRSVRTTGSAPNPVVSQDARRGAAR
jgi:peptidoglycan/xylan/chitin deacetylase (PgdA/CDA1 family)